LAVDLIVLAARRAGWKYEAMSESNSKITNEAL
jgi:hypothetical protein